MNRRYGAGFAALLILAGCSSKPRMFEPQFAAAPAQDAEYRQVLETCRTLVAKGHRSNFKSTLVSAGTGVAAGIGIPVGIAAMGEVATYAVATSASVLMPLVGIGAAWGMAKAKKNKKERDVKQATATCLGEHDYVVSEWKVAKKRRSTGTGATLDPVATAADKPRN